MQVPKAKRKDPWAGFKRNSVEEGEKPHIKRRRVDSSPADAKDKPDPYLCLKHVSGVVSASNLLDVKHHDILVEILDNGCKVTCCTCRQYQMAQQNKRLVNCCKRIYGCVFRGVNLEPSTDCLFLLNINLVKNDKKGLLPFIHCLFTINIGMMELQ